MADININEYIRTKTGYIGKCYKISTYKINNKDKTMYLAKFNIESYGVSITDIAKHSKNLIDLIEENDILEYQLFGKPKVDRVRKYKDGRTGGEMLLIEGFKLSNAKILSITTHEHFEQMKYVVEE